MIVARSVTNSLRPLLASDVRVIQLLRGKDDSLDRSRPRRVLMTAFNLWRTLRQVRQPMVLYAYMPMSYGIAALVNRFGCGAVMVAGRRSLSTYRSYGLIERLLGHIANRFIDIHVCNSFAVATHAITEERLDPRLMRVVHNGVFLPETSSVRDNETSAAGQVRAAVVANFHEYKGHRYLFLALQDAALGTALVVDLYGYGRRSDELRQQVVDLGLEEVVRFRGAPLDAGALLGDYDFTILPSMTEGLPNSILESMAHGVPAIASRIGGIPEIIDHGVDGLLVAPADVAGLTRAIRRLTMDADLRNRLGIRARQTVSERFSMEAMVSGTEAVYAEILGAAAQDRISVSGG